MTQIVAIGERTRLAGYAAVGVDVMSAEDGSEVLAAWERLGDGVSLLMLTATARETLEPRLRERPQLVWAVLP